MGRGVLPLSEDAGSALEELARRIEDAVAAREFERARALVEEAIIRVAGAREEGTSHE
jgi:hypothetical protein